MILAVTPRCTAVHALTIGALAILMLSAPSARADDAAAEPASEDKIEGAIGLVVQHRPAYAGSSDFETKLVPAGFLRWGRVTVTGAGGFTTRRKDEVERGLGAELLRRPSFRTSLNLRYDNGRSESESPGLAGMGKISRTVRARLSARWDVAENLQLSAGLSVDALGRVGGYLVDVNLARHWSVAPFTTWHMSAGVSAASQRYMQAWHGVTAEQSARSGYPVYQVPSGLHLRDFHVSGTLRTDFTPRWSAFGGVGWSRELGPAADSPLTRDGSTFSLSTGLVWRF